MFQDVRGEGIYSACKIFGAFSHTTELCSDSSHSPKCFMTCVPFNLKWLC
jgi:hypothetical protein